ncbi:PREDICTED: uncharacterized protein LOC106335280 [Brassica oleracea var. oleracea]|uniref:Uncharacterized protein n=1 Tax=Brassica oleracea var. oleracea TaxID=109376 RepID=A0A0D3BG20_BRAOL|nr:PREDICTED: uncharacterized protein LOC106335280 [Brassica oleracea var. oleracea]
MADGYGYGYGYGGFSGVPYPIFLTSPSPHPPTSAPPIQPFESSYDPTQGGFDQMISHGSYHRSPADWSNYPSYGDNSRSQTPSSSFGNLGPRAEDSHKDLFSPSGFNPSRGSPSDAVPFPTENFLDRQRYEWVPYTSASLADMLIRNSQEPFYKPIPPSGVNASSNAFDDKRPGYYHHGYDKPESMNANTPPGLSMEPCVPVPSLPVSSMKTEALFDGSQTGVRVGDGRSIFGDAPENIQSSLHGSSVEPVNFDVLLGYGEATGHVKPLSEKTVGSPSSRSLRSSNPLHFNVESSGSLFKEKREGSGVSSLYQMPNTFVADIENGISESSLKNAIDDLNCKEHRSWSHFRVSSEGPSAPTGSEPCGAMKADNGYTAHSAVNYKTPSEGSANQTSEDVQASAKTCKLQEQLLDTMNRAKKTSLLTDVCIKGSSRSDGDDVSTGRSPEKHLSDEGDFPSPPSSPRVSSVIIAMHNLSEVLVYECFNNGSYLMPEQIENLDKVVENLTKCLKKITSNKTIAGEASVPTPATNVSCPNVVDLNEAPNVVAKDCQGFNVKPLDIFGLKEPVDKDTTEMTQSIKNILTSKFPDGEEKHPQTLLYKNLWLETEAALCSSTCMARYHRIKNETDNLKSQNKEVSVDASTFMQEPFLYPTKSVSIMNTAEQETTESLIKHGSYGGNNVVTMSHEAPQSFKFNSNPVDAVLSPMSRSFTEKENHGNVKPTAGKKYDDVIDRFQILKLLETKRKLKSQNCPDSDIGVMDRLQILRPQETDCKLNSQNFTETREDNPDHQPSEITKIGRSSHVTDVMDRFQILKRREAEQVQKSLNSLDTDSDSEDDQSRNKTQICDHLWPDSMMTVCRDSQNEMHAGAEPSGYSDWEHVLRDD